MLEFAMAFAGKLSGSPTFIITITNFYLYFYRILLGP